MKVDFFGPNDNFFDDAFFGGPNGLDDVDVTNATPTEITLLNTVTGAVTILTGVGLTLDIDGNPTGGTLSNVTFEDGSSVVQAALSGFNWSFVDFFAALLAADSGDETLLDGLINGSGTFHFDAAAKCAS